MITSIIKKLVDTLKNLDKKNLKILIYGLKFSFVVALISVSILCTYLFFIHSDFVFQIGLTVFQISICFAAEFFTSAIAIDSISKQNL